MLLHHLGNVVDVGREAFFVVLMAANAWGAGTIKGTDTFAFHPGLECFSNALVSVKVFKKLFAALTHTTNRDLGFAALRVSEGCLCCC